jgi:hypothetical protein
MLLPLTNNAMLRLSLLPTPSGGAPRTGLVRAALLMRVARRYERVCAPTRIESYRGFITKMIGQRLRKDRR